MADVVGITIDFADQPPRCTHHSFVAHIQWTDPDRPLIFYRRMSFLPERHVAPTYSGQHQFSLKNMVSFLTY